MTSTSRTRHNITVSIAAVAIAVSSGQAQTSNASAGSYVATTAGAGRFPLATAGRHTDGEPAVKYREIFINDEAPAFSGWTRETFGGVNSKVYTKVFELILRMKGNYLWPAMWGNAFADDDSASARLADEYGIVMGTSHHEPLTRAQQEWRRYGKGPWDYEKNDSTLRDFWRKGIERMVSPTGTRENLVTVGMRGDGDMPMTQGTAIALLERIVADQRKIISDVTGKPASETPQLWALYKEVQDYYDQGMKVPDDITLLFADDNWGNIRRLPKPALSAANVAADRSRPGGFGVYYHFDYVGGPHNYKWLNTTPIARVWDQMHMAHEMGANRIWIVNVGDIKPMELPIEFFLDYAWKPERWPAERLHEYTRSWAERTFGREHSAAIAGVVTRYLKYSGRRKPELLDTVTYSLANYREAERVVGDWEQLVADAQALNARLHAGQRDAYYQLVLHPVLAYANLQDLYVTVAKNRAYARQGRASTNDLAERARRLFERDAEISRYYNDTLAGGKWSHMMDQTHIGYTYWQEPPRNMMPRVDLIQVPLPGELGVAFEGQVVLGPGGGGPPPGPPGSFRPREPAFPDFDVYQQQKSWIDLYNRGQTPVAYAVQASEPWVLISSPKGTLARDARRWVSIDWAKVPVGRHKATVTVTSPGTAPNARPTTIAVTVDNPPSPRREQVVGFVEGNGYVSMEAEHYARAVAGGGITWQTIPDMGRTLSAVTALPTTAPARTPGGTGPRLEYRMHTFGSGEVTVRAYVSPTLNVSGGQGLRYAISIDDEAPQIVNIHADGSSDGRTDGNRAWEQGVDPGIVLQKIVVDLGGVRPSYLGPPESYYRP